MYMYEQILYNLGIQDYIWNRTKLNGIVFFYLSKDK
jgi:hypothetical protein